MPYRGKPIAPSGQSGTIIRTPVMQEQNSRSCEKKSFPNEGGVSSFYGAMEDPRSFPPKADEREKLVTSGDIGSDRELKKVKGETLGENEGTMREADGCSSTTVGSSSSGAALISQSKSQPSDCAGTDPGIRRIREPLKKRKRHLDFLRRNRFEFQSQQTQDDGIQSACQVSPVSFASGSFSRHQDDKQSEGTNDTLQSIPSSQSEYPLIKEIQSVIDPRGNGSIAQITPCPPSRIVNEVSHQLVTDFPQILHYVLSESLVIHQVAEPVLRWLPHGRAWRILGRDALRETVLPRFFPTLCYEVDSSLVGSIEAFLWNVRCWGFQEVTDGPDMGAYAHDYFVKSMPNLCKDMKYSSVSPSEKEPGGSGSARVGSDTVLRAQSPLTYRSDLLGGDDTNMHGSTGKHPAQFCGGYHQSYPDDYSVFQPYSDYHQGYHYTWQYPSNMSGPYNQSRTYHGQHSIYESPHGANFISQNEDVRPSIRSGRGGNRIKTSSRDDKLDGRCNRFASQMNKIPKFPVSQRGRGTRHPTYVSKHES